MSEVEGCDAVDGGDGGGTATWLGEIHVCGVKPVIGSGSLAVERPSLLMAVLLLFSG